jgi:DnaA family protein
MTRQIPLALELQHAPRLDDFIVGSNQAVLDALASNLDPHGESVVYLSGPAGCGRTHLLLAQCAEAQALGLQSAYLPFANTDSLAPEMLDGLEMMDLVAVDDVDRIATDDRWEAALFALFNRCRDRGTRLLFSADCGPSALPVALPDLRSRLAWGLTLAVQPLDDRGRVALLQSLARRRALDLPDDVARYLLDRGTRHPRALDRAVEQLDRASLAEQRRLTIPFVRTTLGL